MTNPNRHSAAQGSAIPEKLYFSAEEVCELCAVKPHVLRYWEQEFPQLSSVVKSDRQRFYQYRDVVLIREISRLLNQEGYTIHGAREALSEPEDRPESSRYTLLIRHLVQELEDLKFLLKD